MRFGMKYGRHNATVFTQTGEMGEVGGPHKKVVTIHGAKVAIS